MPKKASRSSKSNPRRRPSPTGVRRFFFKLELLGKRRTDLPFDYSNLDPIVNTPPTRVRARDPSHSPQPYGKDNKPSLLPSAQAPTPTVHNVPWPGRVALINEDHTEDAVVITTLDTVPFCCHEDLITMSRDQLINVALALNARLPSALGIGTDETLTTTCIRASIERVVGIRPDVPGAPKVVKVSRDSEGAGGGGRVPVNRTLPASPLASRSQQIGSMVSPGLDRLVEEDEGEDEDEADRHSKKRKLVFDNTGDESDSDVVMASDREQTPTPLPRLQRAGSCVLNVRSSPSPTPTRVLRSHSLSIGRVAAIDTSFMYMGRPQARYQRKTTKEKVETRIDQDVLPPIGATRRSGRLRPISKPRVSLSFVPAESSTTAHSEATTGAKRKRTVGSFDSEVAHHVASGFGPMTARSDIEWYYNGMDVGF